MPEAENRYAVEAESIGRYYAPRRAPDGVWEIPLVLSDVSEASDSTLPLPLPYRRLNADVLEYLEDAAQDLPKKAAARIAVYLPAEKIAPEMQAKLNAYLGVFRRAKLAQAKRRERRALHDVLKALVWGAAFMLGCQIVRYFANFPDWPTLTNTISEGLLVLGWVALWNPYDRLLFSWLPEVQRRRRIERLALFPVELRPLPADAAALLDLQSATASSSSSSA